MDSLICGENGQEMDDASGNNTEVNFHCCLQLQEAYRKFLILYFNITVVCFLHRKSHAYMCVKTKLFAFYIRRLLI